MKTSAHFLFIAVALLGAASANAQCSTLYGQCGGKGWEGPRCCEQPKPDGFFVTVFGTDPVICKKFNEGYSQCVSRCPKDRPCYVGPTGKCEASTTTDGRGRQYCGSFGLSCMDPEVCFSDPFTCVCGGNVPCALVTRPGGCDAPNTDGIEGFDICGGGRRRCPAWDDEQCGGVGFEGPSSCQPGLTCIRKNKNYSSCQR